MKSEMSPASNRRRSGQRPEGVNADGDRTPAGKITTPAELAQIRAALDNSARKLVFTNGCFDLLHVGHVRYLQGARALGHALVVAVNGDESVRALKGEGRPLTAEEDRAEVLAALACVDYVTIFRDLRVTHLLHTIRPHVYAKGGDYCDATLDPEEGAALREIGAEVRILPLVPGRSTTDIVARWKS